MVNDTNAETQAESRLLRDLVNDTDAIWSMTRMHVSDCDIESVVNDTDAFWSMTQMQVTECRSHSVIDDTNVFWSMTRMPRGRLFCISL